jgi:hypothetical protein
VHLLSHFGQNWVNAILDATSIQRILRNAGYCEPKNQKSEYGAKLTGLHGNPNLSFAVQNDLRASNFAGMTPWSTTPTTSVVFSVPVVTFASY